MTQDEISLMVSQDIDRLNKQFAMRNNIVSLKPIENNFIEIIAARTVARVSGSFTRFLKIIYFDKLFISRTGVTKGSIGAFRTRAKNPTYAVRAGLNIEGGKNYLKALYKGKSKSRSGNYFNFKKERDLLKGGWKQYDRNKTAISQIFVIEMKKAIKEAEVLLAK